MSNKQKEKLYHVTFSFDERVQVMGSFQGNTKEEAIKECEDNIGPQVQNLMIDGVEEVDTGPTLVSADPDNKDNIIYFPKSTSIH